MTRNLSIAELRALQAPLKRQNKFGAVRVRYKEKTFDSKAECARFAALELLQKSGEIRGLEVHPSFDLTVNGVIVGRYVADFLFFKGSQVVVEDVKGGPTHTPLSRLKIKIAKALFPDFDFRIVRAR